eukprot:TRINITY_DN24809_c0_g3_i1.p1 TRINITY_DN24809_c0_g3~~TRINITY_DN24809_c0_g3_i1.p1  ORF type:complete len:148 (-),score=28.18 TRINITY_DN24809_c0_g3_i1:192-635(-)
MIDYPKWLDRSRKNLRSSSGSVVDDADVFLITDKGIDLRYFEPFFVQSRVTVDGPSLRYMEVFQSRHFNKASYVTGLRFTGYNFHVGANHFLLHRDHQFSGLSFYKTDRFAKIWNMVMYKYLMQYLETMESLGLSNFTVNQDFKPWM